MMYDYDEELLKGFEERISAVRENIVAAAREASRDVSDITLIGVSKVFPVSYAEAAFSAGLKDLGENRVQELVPKYDRMKELGMEPNWHLIGTLQTNKVKYIIGRTCLIHSVDSVKLMAEIGKRSEASGLVSDVLIEVNVSGEETKHGFSPVMLRESIDQINGLSGVRVRGLMTMAPIEQYEGQARKVFHDARELFTDMKGYVKEPGCWDTLSMGMSHDYIDAIKEGATHIRIGTAIFGDRNSVKP